MTPELVVKVAVCLVDGFYLTLGLAYLILIPRSWRGEK